MKIIFFGTPDYVLPILSALHKKFVTGPGKSPIVAVVTQKPKPVGRKKILTYSPVDKWAHARKISIFYSARKLLENPPEAEVGILASYGEIIPKSVIDLFPKGILVIHPSLLPKYRGSSPVPETIKNGDAVTGVTIFKMDEKVDHGAIISQFKEDVLPTDTGEGLKNRLFARSAEVLVELIEPYLQNKITPKVQDENAATYTKMITREDGQVDLKNDDPVFVERKFRAYTPWPGIWTKIQVKGDSGQVIEKRLKILSIHLEPHPTRYTLVPDTVQLEGKSPVSWKQFLEGYKEAAEITG